MEALLGRMEGLLARLEEVEGRQPGGGRSDAASAASDEEERIDKAIRRMQSEPMDSVPLAD